MLDEHLRLIELAASEGAQVVVFPELSLTGYEVDRNPLVRFGGNTAAVAVCADIGRPSHPQHAADRGAGTYLASMFVIASDFTGDSAKLSGYAAKHSMTVALANFGSPMGRLAAAGRSSIWSERGVLLAQLDPGGAGIAVATETSEGWRAKAVMLGNLQATTSA